MKSIAKQTGLLSTQPLRGYYRYKDLFQILPVATKNQPHQLRHDSPLIVEICYCPDIWPHRDQLLWYRDLWERERYEHFRNHSSGKGMDPSNGWVKTYESLTKNLRSRAITDEVTSLFTLFTNYRFFKYGSEKYWFIPSSRRSWLQRAWERRFRSGPKSSWRQVGYLFDVSKPGTELSDPAGAKAAMIPADQYYTGVRDAIYVGQDNTVQLPDNIDRRFDLYFGLDQDRKTGFHTACHLYNKALELRDTSASLSLVATVMAIEALVNCVKDKAQPCPKCGASKSIETCPECGLPRHYVGSRFKKFLLEFCPGLTKQFANDLYKTRSTLAHGGLLRDDLHDSGFYAGDKDEQQAFRRESLVVIRIAILNWLLRPKPGANKVSG